MFKFVLLLVAARCGWGFVPHSYHHHRLLRTSSSHRASAPVWKLPSSLKSLNEEDADGSNAMVSPESFIDDGRFFRNTVSITSALLVTVASSPAFAAGPDWGIFEGRTLSLLHPVAMASLLLYSLYTGLLGLQWRRQRTIGGEITALKSQLPDLRGAKTVQEALQAAKQLEGDEYDAGRVAILEAALPTEQELQNLQSERKGLVEASPRDKHFRQGALLAFLGTFFAIEGPLNTYARAGKLFPGPHLYAGAGLVVLWAAAAACVPYMTSGNDTARSIHIAANTIATALFGWQVVSGIPILLKVLEKTSWP